MTKKILLSVALVSVFAATGLVGASYAQAQGNFGNQSNLVQALADHFGLNKAEVQTVFDDYHQERQAERQTEMQTRQEEILTQAVSDGKITEDQKTAILAKTAEIRQKMVDLKNLTAEERQTQITAIQTEMKAWYEAQGIDQTLLGMGMGRFGHDEDNGGRMMGGYRMNNQENE